MKKWNIWIAAVLTFAFLFVLALRLEVYSVARTQVTMDDGFGQAPLQEETLKTWGIQFK